MGANRPSRDPLSAYRAKRSLDRTPEPGARPAAPPAAVGTAGRGGLFVVHMHAARRLHWDLRLELDGVLASWAVPKGPSPNRADKRLAVRVEDHPLEYGDFEGVIPQGNYGAGAVIVWDRGRWVPVEDPREGLRQGKLLFELYGYKLRGRWTLVKLVKSEKDWLLIKERDAYAAAESALPPQSVLSGLTVEELSAGADRSAPVVRALERLKAPRRRRCSPPRGSARSRSRAGCSSPSSTAIASARAARAARRGCSRATGTTSPPRSRKWRAPSPPCRTRASCSTASWWCPTKPAGPASS